MSLELNTALTAEYTNLFNTMVIKPELMHHVKTRVNAIIAYRKRYEAIGSQLGIPWRFIAVVHSMEAGLNFKKHLHNGDPLTGKTTHVPKGRPVADPAAGKGSAYTWEESALDALKLRKLDKVTNWSTARMLWELEGYNGYGYRLYHPDVKSPYLWSFTNHYKKGKYASDGKYDPNLVSQQVGAACLLKLLMEIK